MAVMKSKDGNNLFIDCNCGCDDGLRFRVDKMDYDYYFIASYTNGNFYREQENKILKIIVKKLKKIWAIIRNKDFYYSEICMTKDDFIEFKNYINSIDS